MCVYIYIYIKLTADSTASTFWASSVLVFYLLVSTNMSYATTDKACKKKIS